MALSRPSLAVVAACALWSALMWSRGAPGFAQEITLRVEIVPACVWEDDACVLLAPAPGVACARVGDGCALVETPPEPEPTEGGT